MTANPNGSSNEIPPGVEHHLKTSRRLIRQAGYELNKRGDRVQACDKAAGAVAHGVKALAAARYWRSNSHNYRRRIVTLLADEYGQPELNLMQDTADQLHDNFYEDMMHEREVSVRLELLTGLLFTFNELVERGPQPDFAPDPQQERLLSRLRLSREEIAEQWSADYPPPPPDFEEED